MRPHPHFRTADIPREHRLGAVRLKVLTIDDTDRDYAAVMESAADIKAANPTMTWPDGLTRHDNMIDLAWHQREFAARRSFTWVLEDAAGGHVGCLYVYPSITGEAAANVHWWWRTGTSPDRAGFRAALAQWLAGDPWPDLDYRLRSE